MGDDDPEELEALARELAEKAMREETRRRKTTANGHGADHGGGAVPNDRPAAETDIPQLRIVTAAELLTMDIPARAYALAPVLPLPGLAMLYAPRGMGKTYAAYQSRSASPPAVPRCAGGHLTQAGALYRWRDASRAAARTTSRAGPSNAEHSRCGYAAVHRIGSDAGRNALDRAAGGATGIGHGGGGCRRSDSSTI